MAPLNQLIHRCRGPLLVLSMVALMTLFCGRGLRSSAAHETTAASEESSLLAASRHREWQGVASCASTACHGGNGPRGTKGNEYSTWVLYDKHTKAYQVLSDDRSQRIEKNLRHLKSVKEAHAEQDQLCLRCHAMNADNGPQRDSFVRDFGVGCESCHGPAQAWLGLHYASDWKAKSDAEKLGLGFQPMTRLADRARLCASCHIGGSDREVNHDLIAAGHPRLNFEFGAFQAIMPKHWREEGENAQPDFEARAWAVGQVVSAQAALQLLTHRAGSDSMPWPEFAEYDCFACHHDLREPNWRQQPGHYANRTPGAFTWGSWYYAMLPEAIRGRAGKENAQVPSILAELKKEMQKSSPNRQRVADRAREANTELGRLLKDTEKRHYETAALDDFFKAIRQEDQKLAATNWDGAAQVYLALAALYNALGDMDPGHREVTRRDELKAWAKRLEFHQGYDSPRDFKPKVSGEIHEQAPR